VEVNLGGDISLHQLATAACVCVSRFNGDGNVRTAASDPAESGAMRRMRISESTQGLPLKLRETCIFQFILV
jgi:hypothetical protein